MGKVRNDKKFQINVWVKKQDKDIFHRHCFEYHLSMMFVGEKYLITALTEFPDKQIENIINDNLETFNKLNSKKDGFEVLGIRITNNYWQKLAYFAVMYRTTVAKVASCMFNYCLSSYELKWVEEEYGLVFKQNNRKRFNNVTRKDLNERASDYL